jgi:GNAT superfamily N-acetyltransferase
MVVSVPNGSDFLKIYRKSPCRTLPNAFWKTAVRFEEVELDIQYSPEGQLKSLAIWDARNCLAFWHAHPAEATLPTAKIDQLELALVHGDCLAVFSNLSFDRRQPFFRLRRNTPMEDAPCPPGFMFSDARPETEVEAVSRVIQRCYRNMNVTPAIVRGWLDHPVFDPRLWVWVVEAETGRKAGLGIAEFDPAVPEASLEWIQVLPEFQNQGLGTAIVRELLHRVKGKALFTTVSGELECQGKPERIYRKCGFTGSDTWWLLAN